jgi:hypothetical protein
MHFFFCALEVFAANDSGADPGGCVVYGMGLRPLSC